MTEFQNSVLKVVRLIPSSKVASYGQIAAYIGTPRAARQVGWAMRSLEGTPDFPWWRVVNNSGKITIKGNQFTTAHLQKELLQSEGVRVSDTFELSMTTYRFQPDQVVLRQLQLDAAYVRLIMAKYEVG